ncbi:MAG TPA: META domain-containing protein [Chloroflexia bacterium]|nr:META domain-containing protein [Chloroflexia bacterium]
MIKRLAVAATLILLVAGMPLTAGATAAAQSLANTNWVLAEYTVQGSDAVTALGEPPPTLLFGNNGMNGMVRGYTICNSYNGPYSQSGDQVTFGPLVTTKRACTNPEFVAQEQLMLRVLDGTTTVTRSGDRLTINSPTGSLTFVASDGSDLSDPPLIPPTPGMPTTGQPGMEWPLLLLLGFVPGIIVLGVYLRRAEQTR